MTALALEPHQDDIALFCAFNAIRYNAHIVTVLRSVNQEANGITNDERATENWRASIELGCTLEQWEHPDDDPDWDAVRAELAKRDQARSYSPVFAPWPDEPGAHPQHAKVGQLARDVFGDRCRFYCTYRYGGDKTRTKNEVPYEREWIPLKMRALACYESQITRGPHRFWLMDIREYEAP